MSESPAPPPVSTESIEENGNWVTRTVSFCFPVVIWVDGERSWPETVTVEPPVPGDWVSPRIVTEPAAGHEVGFVEMLLPELRVTFPAASIVTAPP